MTARIRGPLVAACLIALTFAASAPETASADTTPVSASANAAKGGWVRLAQLSPTTAPIDWYVSAAGSASAQVVVKDVGYGTLSPYESLAPGNYVVAIRAAGNAPTGNPLISTQIKVTAGQAYTVAGLGAAAVPTLRVLDDKLEAAQGKAGVRVIEASQRNPTVSVAAGGATIATDLQFPNVTGYQTVAAGASAVRVSTQAQALSKTTNTGAATRLNFAADSTYTVVVLDGTGSAPQIFSLSDGGGVAVPPKGGVNTGFGGMAAQVAGSVSGASSGPGTGTGSESGNVFPTLQLALLIGAVGAVAFALSRRHK